VGERETFKSATPWLWPPIFTCEKIVDERETFKSAINLTEYAAALGCAGHRQG